MPNRRYSGVSRKSLSPGNLHVLFGKAQCSLRHDFSKKIGNCEELRDGRARLTDSTPMITRLSGSKSLFCNSSVVIPLEFP